MSSPKKPSSSVSSPRSSSPSSLSNKQRSSAASPRTPRRVPSPLNRSPLINENRYARSPERRSPIRSPQGTRSPQKNGYTQFIKDLAKISLNMLEDKYFEQNAEDYKKWLLSPGSLQKIGNKSYIKVCETIVDRILEVMYEFHIKIKTDRTKTKKESIIVYAIAASLALVTPLYFGIPDVLGDSSGITAGIFGGIGASLIGVAGGNLYYNNKKLSKKDTEEALKIKELFDEYLECVLAI